MEHYLNSVLLKKLRESVISTLKEENLEHPKNYSLSGVNQIAATFILKMVSKTAIAQFNGAHSALLIAFPEKIDINKNQDQLSMILNLTKAYNELNKDAKKIDDKPPPEGEGKKTRKTFLIWLKDFISDKIFKGREFEGKITKYKGDKKIALVELPPNSFYEALDYFICRQMKVVPTIFKGIIVYAEDVIPVSKGRDQYSEFIKDYELAEKVMKGLNELIRKIAIHYRLGAGGEPTFKPNTFISELALNNFDFKTSFSFTEPDLANAVALALNELSIVSEKVGNLVYVNITKSLTVEIMEKRWGDFVERSKNRKRGFIVDKNANGEDRITHYSWDYSEFHFLPFNRDISQSHVEELRVSFREFGFVDVVLVAKTDVVDGVMKNWIVDRQHRFRALVLEKMIISYKFIYVHSKYELIRLIAALNSKSRKWLTKDYLKAWKWLKMKEYEIIETWHSKLPITVINQAMTGLEPKSIKDKFQRGEIKFLDPEKGEKILNDLLALRPHLPKGVRYLYATNKFLLKMNKTEFSVEKMLSNLLSEKIVFSPDDRDQDIVKKLEKKYAE